MRGVENKKSNKVAVILHNIRSAYNVGSIFRTSDAVGVSKIYLTGHTPTPLDRFGRKRKDIHKTALGAEDSVLWQHVSQIGRLIDTLKKEGYFIIAIEQAHNSLNYRNVSLPKNNPVAFIFGNEVRGLSPQLFKRCDVVAEIPMVGKKESLNVSVSAGIALFQILGK